MDMDLSSEIFGTFNFRSGKYIRKLSKMDKNCKEEHFARQNTLLWSFLSFMKWKFGMFWQFKWMDCSICNYFLSCLIVWSRGRHSGRLARPAKIKPDRAEPADSHPDSGPIGPGWARSQPDFRESNFSTSFFFLKNIAAGLVWRATSC